jgi:hypothetical protein
MKHLGAKPHPLLTLTTSEVLEQFVGRQMTIQISAGCQAVPSIRLFYFQRLQE